MLELVVCVIVGSLYFLELIFLTLVASVEIRPQPLFFLIFHFLGQGPISLFIFHIVDNPFPRLYNQIDQFHKVSAVISAEPYSKDALLHIPPFPLRRSLLPLYSRLDAYRSRLSHLIRLSLHHARPDEIG